MGAIPPPAFDREFLEWFRQRTEAAWEAVPLPSLYHQRMLGCMWQPGTRWLGGLEEEQVAEVERAWSLKFPPDYRLFLRRLHAVDRPMRCTAWREDSSGESQLTLRDQPAFYNWLSDEDVIQSRLDDLVSGLVFDVEQNDLWRPELGIRPSTAEGREYRIHQLVDDAPRLVPIFSHRYLVAEPCQEGNPVLSVWQSDIIVYAANLRDYFLVEFSDILGIDSALSRARSHALIQRQFSAFATIPFWGDLIAN